MAYGVAWLVAAGLALAGAAQAQELRDPTRPPAVLNRQTLGAASATQLQSVLIAPGHQAAIINGETVELGGTYAGAKLIKVGESEVVLQSGANTQTLKLFPDVDKQLKPVAAKQPTAQAAPNKKTERKR